uniref:Uncharacterized protein n=1 Tax=Oryza sativa subsp. japonica TaxID=39947 RepID=Q75K39_ORYSJ|nr:hypothetical protein [Oryza sativa Japonica Group]
MPTSPVTTTADGDGLAQLDIAIWRRPSLLHPELLRDDRALLALACPRVPPPLARVRNRGRRSQQWLRLKGANRPFNVKK